VNQPGPMPGGLVHAAVMSSRRPVRKFATIGRKTDTTSGADYLRSPFSRRVRGGIRDRTFQRDERDSKVAIVNQSPLHCTLIT
jgi:hypothetical protein